MRPKSFLVMCISWMSYEDVKGVGKKCIAMKVDAMNI